MKAPKKYGDSLMLRFLSPMQKRMIWRPFLKICADNNLKPTSALRVILRDWVRNYRVNTLDVKLFFNGSEQVELIAKDKP